MFSFQTFASTSGCGRVEYSLSAGWLIITCLFIQDEVFRLSLDASLENLSSLGHPINRTSFGKCILPAHPTSFVTLCRRISHWISNWVGYSCRGFYFDHFSPISIIFICIFLFYFCKKTFHRSKDRSPPWSKNSIHSGFSIGCQIHLQNLTLIISMSLPDFSFMFFQFIFTEIVCQPLSRCIQIPPLFRMSQWMVSSRAAFYPVQFPSIVLFFPVFASHFCMTEAGNHMARIADLTLQSQNFVVSSLNLFLSWICAISCMLICAFLSLFANFHHIPMENAHFFTLTHVVTAPVYIYIRRQSVTHTSHTSRALLPVAASVFFYCVTLNQILFVSRIVARLSLIPNLKGHSPLRMFYFNLCAFK